ncbi:MAG: hypothetical protein GEU99_18475 [Luteitalea sp.]|nr:hypothetical protein [Luteitalea sp.]
MTASWLKAATRRWRGRTDGDAAEDTQRAALQRFRTAVQDGLSGDERSLEELLQMPGEIGLTDEEVELEVEMIRGALDVLSLRERVAHEGLPILEHQHKVLGTDRCHFRCSAFTVDEGGNRTGRLFLTDQRMLFLASPVLAVPWNAIASVEDDERDIVVRTVTLGVAYRFHCNAFSDARCGAFIAQTLKQEGRAAL